MHIKPLNWVVVLRPTDGLTEDAALEDLRGSFRNALSQEFQGIVLNLADVPSIHSVTFGVLVQLIQEARRAGVKVAACCRTPPVAAAIDLVAPAYWWRFESEEEAVRFCSDRGAGF